MMLKNYIKIAYRNILKSKLNSIIISAGLAIGIAVFIMIYLYVDFELSFDRFNKNAENIYRVGTDIHLRNGQNMHLALSSSQFAEPIADEFPEIITATRLFPISRVLVTDNNNNKLYEDNFWYADSNFFKVFTFEVTAGNINEVLRTPDEILLNESMAKKYFGNENPIGQTFTINSIEKKKITGVFKDHPANSHIQINFLTSGYNLRQFNLPNWGALSLYTYVLLNKNSPASAVEKKIPGFLKEKIGDWATEVFDVHLQPLTSIHLYSDYENDVTLRNDISRIYILSAIAFLILLVACINFMNLSTAKSAKRSKEVGLRKVLGAERSNLIKLFLGESILLTFVSLILSIILIQIFLPQFNELIDRELSINYIKQIPFFLILILIVGLFSGIYPAFYLSAFQPAKVLRGFLTTEKGGKFIRKGLVVFQFAVTIALVVSAIVVSKQMNYIRDKKLGFEKEQVLTVSLESNEIAKNIEVLKNEVKKSGGVINAAATSNTPFFGTWQRAYNVEGPPDNQGTLILHTYFVDYDFINTMGIDLKDGRGFSEEFGSDEELACIVNEAAVKRIGWNESEVIGKRITWDRDAARNDTTHINGKVIGVVKDFNFQTLHSKIEPLVLRIDKSKYNVLLIKLRGEKIAGTVSNIESTYESLEKEFPFESSFLDENFESLYRSELKLGKAFSYFSGMAILIACMGLFALAAFTTEQKTKEIGIRKVLGASSISIIYRLGKEFSILVLIANIMAWPAAYFIMSNWLEDFAYRIELQVWMFIAAGITAFFIALITVGYNSYKAASNNPALSLRSE